MQSEGGGGKETREVREIDMRVTRSNVGSLASDADGTASLRVQRSLLSSSVALRVGAVQVVRHDLYSRVLGVK